MSAVHYVRSIADATTLCGLHLAQVPASTSASDVTCAECLELIATSAERIQNHFTVEVTDTDSVHGIPADSGLDFPTQDELRRRWAIEQAVIWTVSEPDTDTVTLGVIADVLIAYVLRKES